MCHLVTLIIIMATNIRQHDEQPHSLQQIMSAIARLAVSPRLSMAAARSLRPASVQVIIRMVVLVVGIMLVIRMVVVGTCFVLCCC